MGPETEADWLKFYPVPFTQLLKDSVVNIVLFIFSDYIVYFNL